jgi:hypothetical protein
MRSWLPRGWTLVAVLVLAVVAAVVIVSLARRDDSKKGCVSVTVDAPSSTNSPEEALSLYVANQQDEGPLPINLGSYTVTSQSGTETVFTSDSSGHWTVTIRDGGVQSYSGCPT